MGGDFKGIKNGGGLKGIKMGGGGLKGIKMGGGGRGLKGIKMGGGTKRYLNGGTYKVLKWGGD